MTQEQEIQEMHKRFDDRFELERQGCSECGGYELVDLKEIRYPKGKYFAEYDLEKIKVFIESEVEKAIKEERKGIARLIEARIGTITRNKFITEKEMGNFASSAEAQHARVEAYRDTLYIIENK